MSALTGIDTPAVELDEVAMAHIFEDVAEEREAQLRKWGRQTPADGAGAEHDAWSAHNAKLECDAAFAAGRGSWKHLLKEETFKAFAESDEAKLRAGLIQSAAVIVAWVEDLDSRS